MEKTYFSALGTNIKTELAWNYGECITTVEIKDRYISLFLLDTFFVEIHIDKTNNELIEIGLQDDDDVLCAYLKDLDIDNLLTSP